MLLDFLFAENERFIAWQYCIGIVLVSETNKIHLFIRFNKQYNFRRNTTHDMFTIRLKLLLTSQYLLIKRN